MTFLCSIPFLSLLFNACLPPAPLATGYVEGDYVLIAPIETAQIAAIPVKRGERVAFDQPLAMLERRDAEIAVAEAEATIAQARSKLANLNRGARPEKIATLQASIAAAQFSAEEAKRDMDRQQKLMEKGTVSKSRFDQAHTSYDVAKAKVEELKANLAYTKLPAREDEIAAAKASVKQAEAALEKAEWRLRKRTLKASQTGIIVDIIRDLGEVAGPQAPILSLLPDNGTKLRLYLPEKDLASIKVGSQLDVECDGCTGPNKAIVNYISDGPEFTPPVIYSLENRQKLVYQIEARPADGSSLKPGQIVSVRLVPSPASVK
ncbi:HlyD family efflux transporter periplasmic adaptor subunit [Cohaesibacter sp. CAU 1516]|uniref:HlyD family secretion protein n=1 Tax=Cohaesibacter sp. CAU 1516 TaxID=2576038 RepID=UPI0010FD11F3|nr:HlyD family efflux transporter periplasmic adaptor subunit [Cohaesibacter sp. CAU 1516]TLP48372.1 HlyD family efflux transporter periplasmic adaptor subunit [Cohaesibacter sp. CAU 1516]